MKANSESPAPEADVGVDVQDWIAAPAQLAATLKSIAETNAATARQFVSMQQVFESWQQILERKASMLDGLVAAGPLPSRADNGANAELSREIEARPRIESAGDAPPTDDIELERAHWRSQLNTEREEVTRLRGELDRWTARLWPRGLQGEAWANWRADLIERLEDEPNIGVLLAQLHAQAALERSGQIDLRLLSELGRLLCRNCPSDVENVAAALTAASQNQFELRAIRVGDRVDQRFMKPLAPGLTDVQQPAGWAVRDQHGAWQFPAEVR